MPAELSVEIVVAMAENGVIGRDGDLPWRLSADLRHFKRLTTGHTLLMGRKTWQSLPGALPKRRHLVLSRDPDFVADGPSDIAAPGVEVVRSVDEALGRFRGRAEEGERLFAVGGAGIYAQVWDLSSGLHLTRVHAEVDGDTYFPSLDLTNWLKESSERHGSDERNAHPFTIEHWRRDDDPLDEETLAGILRCGELGWDPLRTLLGGLGLELRVSEPGRPIPATFWGEPEAGIRGDVVYARDDTPVHSLLHETCHALLVDEDRRAALDVDAGGNQLEEDAVCVLQMLLADRLPGVGRKRLATDMDAWGYSFLAGSAADFFARDSQAARELVAERLPWLASSLPEIPS